MLQRLISLDDELYGDGLWSRAQLEAMDAAFVARVEAAFRAGFESRSAAAASVKMNGKQRADEIAIELAWRYLRTNMDAGIDISFVEICARCPGVDPARIGAEIKQRLMETMR